MNSLKIVFTYTFANSKFVRFTFYFLEMNSSLSICVQYFVYLIYLKYLTQILPYLTSISCII